MSDWLSRTAAELRGGGVDESERRGAVGELQLADQVTVLTAAVAALRGEVGELRGELEELRAEVDEL